MNELYNIIPPERVEQLILTWENSKNCMTPFYGHPDQVPVYITLQDIIDLVKLSYIGKIDNGQDDL